MDVIPIKSTSWRKTFWWACRNYVESRM